MNDLLHLAFLAQFLAQRNRLRKWLRARDAAGSKYKRLPREGYGNGLCHAVNEFNQDGMGHTHSNRWDTGPTIIVARGCSDMANGGASSRTNPWTSPWTGTSIELPTEMRERSWCAGQISWS